jgi:serralysin
MTHNSHLLARHALIVLLSVVPAACKEDLGQVRLCTQVFVDSAQAGLGPQAAAPRSSLWPHNASFPVSIWVSFLNGSDFQKQKVKQYAKEWSEASFSWVDFRGHKRQKISIVFFEGGNYVAPIRIAFNSGGGSSSVVGSEANAVEQGKPTMIFGWINENTSEADIRRVVLHEFGHAIGLVHEHQSPVARIPWDREKVYEYYRITQSPPWSREKVDRNIFAVYDATTTNYTAYDMRSIMHYPIPEELTVGDYATPWNTSLSPTDSAFLKTMYPYRPCIMNETPDCCFDRKGKKVPCP